MLPVTIKFRADPTVFPDLPGFLEYFESVINHHFDRTDWEHGPAMIEKLISESPMSRWLGK